MEEQFGFEEALKRIKEGKKVKRAHWVGYWFISNKSITFEIPESAELNPIILASLKDNDGLVTATAYQEDLLAEDWSEVE